MSSRPLAPDIQRDLEDLQRELERDRPALAQRLEAVVERIKEANTTTCWGVGISDRNILCSPGHTFSARV